MVEEVMEEFEVAEWDYGHGKKHPFVWFLLGGRAMKFALASTPSDRRGILNSRADLRRMCRLAGQASAR
jgi:hypothetical protein